MRKESAIKQWQLRHRGYRVEDKDKTGSRIRFATAPIATENIPVVAYPCALIKGFMPVDTIDGKVPIR